MDQNNKTNNGNIPKDKKKVPLSTMVESGDFFIAQEKKYKIYPLKLKDIQEFSDDSLVVGEAQIFNLLNEGSKKLLDKWIKKQVTNKEGTYLSLEDLIKDEWDLDDLKSCVKNIIRVSG